jgi:hypothetical protein
VRVLDRQAVLEPKQSQIEFPRSTVDSVVFTQDLQLRYTWITPPVLAWDYRKLLGSADAESFGAGTSVALSAALPPKSSARNRPRA